MQLDSFALPPGCIVRPLQGEERRVAIAGRYYVVNGKSAVPELQGSMDFPTAVFCIDQGSVGWSAIQYGIQKMQRLVRLTNDPNHRTWNDIKAACKKSAAYTWRTMMELTLVFNLNYGPFGSKQWGDTKREMQKSFLERNSAESPHFRKYASRIAAERGLADPITDDQYKSVFEQLRSLESFDLRGPLVKMMRWFSFFESCNFFKPDLHALKMILEDAAGIAGGADSDGEAPGASTSKAFEDVWQCNCHHHTANRCSLGLCNLAESGPCHSRASPRRAHLGVYGMRRCRVLRRCAGRRQLQRSGREAGVGQNEAAARPPEVGSRLDQRTQSLEHGAHAAVCATLVGRAVRDCAKREKSSPGPGPCSGPSAWLSAHAIGDKPTRVAA